MTEEAVEGCSGHFLTTAPSLCIYQCAARIQRRRTYIRDGKTVKWRPKWECDSYGAEHCAVLLNLAALYALRRSRRRLEPVDVAAGALVASGRDKERDIGVGVRVVSDQRRRGVYCARERGVEV